MKQIWLEKDGTLQVLTDESLDDVKRVLVTRKGSIYGSLYYPDEKPEPLTDKEQRIFLAAMGREEKVCKQVDEECRDCKEPYENNFVSVCHEIIRKVKAALWET